MRIVSLKAAFAGILVSLACGCAQLEKQDFGADRSGADRESAELTEATPAPLGPKRVVIDKSDQILRAYEGDTVVIESRVSTGKTGKRTPNGSFNVGVMNRMHYSSLYDNAPMPYSVQVSGNYFIHGYSSVPNYPASHGCIRLPLTGDNPAKRFYEWVEPGTPVKIVGAWAS